MDNILFICPNFMDYTNIIISELKKKYNVVYFDTEQYLVPNRNLYNSMHIMKKVFYKLFQNCRELYREDMLSSNDEIIIDRLKKIKIEDFKYLLVVNGDGLSNKVYEFLIESNPNIKSILYIWDDIDWLFKRKHFSFFDKIVSYNIDDCLKYNFEYMPVFTNHEKSQNNLIKKYDISIVSSASKDRVKYAKKLYKKYNKHYNIYVYFYSKDNKYDFFSHSKPLSYKEYMSVVSSSKAIFEMGRNNQRGPTTRIFDSLSVKTKIITTNKNIKKYPIFNDNILIVDRSLRIPNSFINSDFINFSQEFITINKWVENLLEVVKNDS